MKKILIFIPSLEHGGAEGVMVDVANYLAEKNYSINLVVANASGVLKEKVSSKITVIDLKLNNFWFSFFQLPFLIRKTKPDFLFTTIKESNFILLVSAFLSRTDAKIIIREANTVSQEAANENRFIQRMKNKIIFKTYRFADKIIVLSEEMRADLLEFIPVLPNHLIKIISNPVNVNTIRELSKEAIPENEEILIKGDFFVCVGRLHEQKNYEFALNALAEYKEKYGEFTMFILGTGRLKDNLNNQISKLKLEENCYLLGYRNNPFKYMDRADVFILPSVFEGMSNSLIQATCLGTKTLVSSSQSTSLEWQNKTNTSSFFKLGSVSDFVDKLHHTLLNRPTVINKEAFSIVDTLPMYEDSFTK